MIKQISNNCFLKYQCIFCQNTNTRSNALLTLWHHFICCSKQIFYCIEALRHDSNFKLISPPSIAFFFLIKWSVMYVFSDCDHWATLILCTMTHLLTRFAPSRLEMRFFKSSRVSSNECISVVASFWTSRSRLSRGSWMEESLSLAIANCK